MAKRRKVGNLLALALLSLLAQQPMYPYEMAQTLKARGKDNSIKINWGSLYTVVQNLEKYGFIEVDGHRARRPPAGADHLPDHRGRPGRARDWMRDLLSVPGEETSGFAAALSEAGGMHPDEVVELLTTRLATLDAVNAAEQAGLKALAERLPRLFLIESEYQLAMRIAEAGWVRGLISEIVTGTLSGVDAWRKFRDTGEVPDVLRQLLDEEAKRRWDEPGM